MRALGSWLLALVALLWLYQYGPAHRPLEQTEVVVLFGRSGEVAEARLRPAP